MTSGYTELQAGAPYPSDLNARIKAGEVFVARQFLQRLDLYDHLKATSLEGVRQVAGEAVAKKVAEAGLERIHEHTDLSQIAGITNAIYKLAAGKVTQWVSKIAPAVLNDPGSYYFEKSPNIRFITPYDYMIREIEALAAFDKAHGGGKMTPHPPHRDSWVDCPEHITNVWIAIGPIPHGNGLTIFPEAFRTPFKHYTAGYRGTLAYDEQPGQPIYIDLDAGDAILFDGEHLHSTVLNHVDTTRHVISFRVTDRKPHYRGRHYHHYLHSALAQGPLKALAELPANLSWGWLRTRLEFVAEKLGLMTPPSIPNDCKQSIIPGDGNTRFALSSLEENSLRPINDSVCVARIGSDRVVAFNRRCPHDGADFAVGSIHEGRIVCPWHNLPFSPDTGASPCEALKQLRFYETTVENDTVTINLDKLLKTTADTPAAAAQAQ